MHSRMRSLRERHFVTTFILQYSSQKKKKYSFLELNNYSGSFKKIIIIVVICVQFITIVSLHIYSLLKVRLIFHPKKDEKKKKVRLIILMKQKINAKE